MQLRLAGLSIPPSKDLFAPDTGLASQYVGFGLGVSIFLSALSGYQNCKGQQSGAAIFGHVLQFIQTKELIYLIQ